MTLGMKLPSELSGLFWAGQPGAFHVCPFCAGTVLIWKRSYGFRGHCSVRLHDDCVHIERIFHFSYFINWNGHVLPGAAGNTTNAICWWFRTDFPIYANCFATVPNFSHHRQHSSVLSLFSGTGRRKMFCDWKDKAWAVGNRSVLCHGLSWRFGVSGRTRRIWRDRWCRWLDCSCVVCAAAAHNGAGVALGGRMKMLWIFHLCNMCVCVCLPWWLVNWI